MTRNDPREPVQQELPARLDPRAGRRPTPARRARSGGAAKLALGTRVVAALAAAAVLGTSGWGWYLGEVADATVNRLGAIPTDGNVSKFNGEAMNLLLVGSDSRARLTEEQRKALTTGGDSGRNTDTMILVHVPGDGSAASFVSFPRDSLVEIPGYDGEHKLNAAYAYGYQEAAEGASEEQRQAAGARLLIQTISSLTGLQIDHYAEVDLLGFFQLSTVVGGVEVNLCRPAKEPLSGIDLPAGRQTISGEQALAFVRQRHGLLRGDYDRIVRQQTFIAAMVRKMLDQEVLLNLGKQRELVGAAAEALTVDDNLNLMNLASQMQSVTAGDIQFQTIPMVGDERHPDLGYVARLVDQPQMHEFFRTLTADPEPEPAAPTSAAPETVAPADITVDVYNGSGISGLARTAAADLAAQGFGTGTTGNADSADYTVTEVRHAPGEEARATTVAGVVPGAEVLEDADVPAGTVHVVLGSDFNGVGQAVTEASSAPAAASSAQKPRTAADTDCIN